MEHRVEITATSAHNKMRLEDFLLDHFSGLSKMYLRELVKLERCEVNGRPENIGFRLKGNDFVEIDVDMRRGTSMRPEAIPLDIVFEDEHLIVVNKPPGMLAHPSHRENSGTLLNALVYHFNRGSEPPAAATTGPLLSERPAVASGLTWRVDDSGNVNSHLNPPATAGGSAKSYGRSIDSSGNGDSSGNVEPHLQPPATAGGSDRSFDGSANMEPHLQTLATALQSEPPAVAGGSTSAIEYSGNKDMHGVNSSSCVNPHLQPPATAGDSDRVVRPGLIHRLDKQTSGLMVVAKTARAHRILSGHFMRKRVEKRYMALVDGIVEQNEGVIEAPIGRYDELKFWSVKADGKHSETRFSVLERRDDTTLLELEPVTGRTNQLRIHCELIGHPIVGDIKRGGRDHERLCLHACRLAFPHPESNEMMRFEAPMPQAFG